MQVNRTLKAGAAGLRRVCSQQEYRAVLSERQRGGHRGQAGEGSLRKVTLNLGLEGWVMEKERSGG